MQTQTGIPIQNIFYLYCYAWDRFPEGRQLQVDVSESPDFIALLTHALIRGLNIQIKRGLIQDYKEVREEVAQIRGKVSVTETLRRHLHIHGRAQCEYDEFHRDVLPNQIIKATLRDIAKVPTIVGDLRDRVLGSIAKLREVSDLTLETSHFRRVRLAKNMGLYQLMTHICLLIHESLLPEDRAGARRFTDPFDNQERMSGVFERFVRNFYRVEQKRFSSVRSEEIRWDSRLTPGADDGFLPAMITDVTLRSSNRTVILDTKYYKDTLTGRYDSKKVWSSHLYQLFAYLKNFRNSEAAPLPEGLLLYPAVGTAVDLRYVLGGHPVRVATVNLDVAWKQIHQQLLSLLEPTQQISRQPASV